MRRVISNQSVPADTLLAHAVYEDVAEAIARLSSAFGFREHFRYGDPDRPAGAQIRLGKACIMLRETRPGEQTPKQLGSATQSLTIFSKTLASTSSGPRQRA